MKSLLLIACLALCVIAPAQMVRVKSQFNFLLLGNLDVQRELKLTPEVKSKVSALLTKLRDESMMQFDGTVDPLEMERQAKEQAAKIDQSAREQVSQVLDSVQMERFTQLNCQYLGIDAFTLKEVEEALALTDVQKSVQTGEAVRFEQYEEALLEANHETLDSGQVVLKLTPQQLDLAKRERQASVERMLAVLTEDQRKTWSGLVGEKLDLPYKL